MSGSRAVAEAAKLAGVNVVSAYPITPQTSIVEYLSESIAKGELAAEFLQAESEFGAMSACIGASSVGARVFTATCSQGLALMHELNYVAAGLRLPIVMAVTNRQLSQPLGMWCDHSDAMGERDSGWIQIYVESCQEALDTVIQAFRIAEDKDVLLPTMVCLDGFILSHTSEPVDVPSSEAIQGYLPPYRPDADYHALMDVQKPLAAGGGCPPAFTMEFDYKKYKAQENAKGIIRRAGREFEGTFGRPYDLVEAYRCEDADVVLAGMGTMIGTAKEVTDKLRNEKGWPVGVLKLRCYRPFPTEDVQKIASRAKALATVSRAVSYGIGAPVYSDIATCMSNGGHKPVLLNFIAGMGGRDITQKNIERVFEKGMRAAETGETETEAEWLGLNKNLVEG
jgi:pyruvate ferredoxin oxidoreductase alpha subunit